jgi:hypothetical protein
VLAGWSVITDTTLHVPIHGVQSGTVTKLGSC